ncbi:cytochrome P450 94A1-like protein [Carex littledalei]|uniref:Cytochrome P450 94A1-like protein n=1 Tax=Carex littledalei TaxID=544730 RepID=A0A833QWG0_9POAL|nr:cytochrome P450 94A1-like protein [Carex littledalei]
MPPKSHHFTAKQKVVEKKYEPLNHTPINLPRSYLLVSPLPLLQKSAFHQETHHPWPQILPSYRPPPALHPKQPPIPQLDDRDPITKPNSTMGFSSIGSTSGIFTANPANVEHMLKLNSSNYPKGERTISMMEDFLGHGIFNSDGEDWKWQRKTASFEFNKKVVIGEDPACLTEEEFSGYSSSKQLMAALSDAQDLSSSRFLEPFEDVWRIKKFLNIGTENRLKKALSIVQGYTMNIIHSRMLKGMELDGREDMLSRFASNKDHNEVVLRDVVTSFLLAGRETTSTALTWYPVFHAGPRMCLGKEMAYIQMKSIVACVLERFQIKHLGKAGIPDHALSLTLRMKGGLPVRITKRQD